MPAAYKMMITNFDNRWFLAALFRRHGAPVFEAAALGQMDRIGHNALDRLQPLFMLPQLGDGVEQPDSVRMGWIVVQGANICVLYYSAHIHHGDIIADSSNHAQVVGDIRIDILNSSCRLIIRSRI